MHFACSLSLSVFFSFFFLISLSLPLLLFYILLSDSIPQVRKGCGLSLLCVYDESSYPWKYSICFVCGISSSGCLFRLLSLSSVMSVVIVLEYISVLHLEVNVNLFADTQRYGSLSIPHRLDSGQCLP
ncbi:hypothetical protein BDV40DRAFT_34483 [Aspergillus tamarii]|uniref:Uncharacterized protein n=1 Tax=Aspergillus tamarii TaxID=41984 RepID=A0A5N6UH55_ASPTM|nr:hypothetical protein BDV40DRAFT_34483 [Aspergillus tamarii]